MKYRHIRPVIRWIFVLVSIILVCLVYQNWYLYTKLDTSSSSSSSSLTSNTKNRLEALLTMQLEQSSLNGHLRGQLTENIQKLKESYEKDIADQFQVISSLQDQIKKLTGLQGEKPNHNDVGPKETIGAPVNQHNEGNDQAIAAETDKQSTQLSTQDRNNNNDKSNDKDNGIVAPSSHALGANSALLIIASSRHEYLKRTLTHVIENHPMSELPVIISEDGDNNMMAEVITEAQMKLQTKTGKQLLHHWHHPVDRQKFYENGYFKLADHFQWALTQVFNNPKCNRVIILEEDIQIAPDFFEFFASVAPMLDRDETLLAASAWNDNGMKSLVADNTKLYRSDFFPGLGWMMTRQIWTELSAKWPRAYWDDWLREPKQRKDRNIIRPEVCRTYHFGVKGVSNSEFGNFLADIKLNSEFVPFTTMDLSYLEKANWDKQYLGAVYSAPLVTRQTFDPNSFKEVRMEYTSLEGPGDSFVSLAHWSGAMDNIKANIPRTAYHGVVSVWKNGVKVHIAPRNL